MNLRNLESIKMFFRIYGNRIDFIYRWVLLGGFVAMILITHEDRVYINVLNDQLHYMNHKSQTDDETIKDLSVLLEQYQQRLKQIKPTMTKAVFVQNELSCLAQNIYHEARGEPEDGQLAVATVTMNRVADPNYPKTICGVVKERHINRINDKIVCMFSWVCKPPVKTQAVVYKQIVKMARAVYFRHERNEKVADATLYHANYIDPPNWADPDNLVAVIGQHEFYRQ